MNTERMNSDASGRTEMPWPVMVLAHNEEKHIAACLDSLLTGEPNRRLDIFVMANGCTDRTEDIVRDYATRHDGVHLVSIELGDKCNAWNQFIFDVVPNRVPDRGVYYFMDGDARIVPGSLTSLRATLASNARAHAAAAPPASGRSLVRDRRDVLENRRLVANLYALRGDIVRRLRDEAVRLPLGLEGDDGLLGALVKWDLDPAHRGFDDDRIAPCPSAGFLFDSVPIANLRQWPAYWRRLVRYGRRRYEFQLLGEQLKKHGLAGLPKHIAELYGDASRLKLMWSGLYTIPNWVALRGMRRESTSARRVPSSSSVSTSRRG